MESIPCTQCGSTRIIPAARTAELTGGGPLAVCVNANPDAILFKGTHTGYLKARICGDCGHTELYVDNAQELYEAYARSRQAVEA